MRRTGSAGRASVSTSRSTSLQDPDETVIVAVPLFAGLDSAAREVVVASAQLCRVAAGDLAFRQGDDADVFFVLLEGYLKAVQIDSAGRQTLIHHVSPREFFGCVALMEAQRYPASMQAVEDSIMLGWQRAEIIRLARCHPALAANALSGFGGRMLDLQSRLRDSHTKADRRIAQVLLRLVAEKGCDAERGVAIDFPITRQEVGEMAGTTLHTASRLIAGWERHGILACGRQKITVIDRERLAALAGCEDDG